MRNFTILVLLLMCVASLNAETEAPKTTVHLWTDIFGGPNGAVLYPQYAWDVNVRAGKLSGYGFVESAPHERLFTNNLVVYTPPRVALFSVQTETGGVPNHGMHFFQIGPRVNFAEAVPRLRKPLNYFFVAALPRFEGIRPNNILIAGATNRFRITDDLQGSIEGFRRFFPHRPDYGECWFLIHSKRIQHFSGVVFVLNDGGHVSVGLGTRISVF